ncbi:MAG: hypothetical protein J6M93_03575 [Succinivibrio sp.]|nr:hypothetical protein [Succinivibrio sp.]
MKSSALTDEALVNLEYPFPFIRRNLTREQRATQFKPFDALEGYSEAVNETFRETATEEPELDDDTAQKLTRRFSFLLDRISSHPQISVIWFEPDRTKSGGSFKQAQGRLLKYDSNSRRITLSGGQQISLCTMFGINCDFLED